MAFIDQHKINSFSSSFAVWRRIISFPFSGALLRFGLKAENKYKICLFVNVCTLKRKEEKKLYRKSNKKHLSRTKRYLHNNQMEWKRKEGNKWRLRYVSKESKREQQIHKLSTQGPWGVGRSSLLRSYDVTVPVQ